MLRNGGSERLIVDGGYRGQQETGGIMTERNVEGSAVVMIGGRTPGSIGRTIAERLVLEGMHVYRLDLPGREEDLDPGNISEYTLSGGGTIELTNMRSESLLNVVMSDARWNGDIIQGVVYAAGYNELCSVACSGFDRVFQKSMQVNALGPLRVAGTLVQQLAIQEQYTGSDSDWIVRPLKLLVLGSNTAYVAKTRSAAYAASKAALVQGLRCVHREHAKDGLHCTTLDFGLVMDTRMTQRTIEQLGETRGWTPEEAKHKMLQNVPTGEPVTRAEVADWVWFLLTHDTSAGGCSIRFDGGQQQG